MKISQCFLLNIIAVTLLNVAFAQAPDKLDKGVLAEVPASSDTAPLAALLEKATPAIGNDLRGAPAPPPTLPKEWRNFTPTATQNPSACFVGTLMIKDSDGNFTSSSESIFLVDKACKPPMTVDSKEDKVYTYAKKVQAGVTLDLGVVKLNFGKDEAVQLTLSRIGGTTPTSGIDGQSVDNVKKSLDIEHNKKKYWICTAQELFVTTYQKFHKDTVGGSGSYSVVKIDGTYFTQTDELKKLYNFRLQLVPLESWVH